MRAALLIIASLCLLEASLYAVEIRLNAPQASFGRIRIRDFNARDGDNINNGFRDKRNGHVVRVRSRQTPWKLSIKAVSLDLGTVGSYTKPLSDLLWKSRGNFATQANFVTIDNQDREVASGPIINSFQRNRVDYRVLLFWQRDIPGAYSVEVLFTVTSVP